MTSHRNHDRKMMKDDSSALKSLEISLRLPRPSPHRHSAARWLPSRLAPRVVLSSHFELRTGLAMKICLKICLKTSESHRKRLRFGRLLRALKTPRKRLAMPCNDSFCKSGQFEPEGIQEDSRQLCEAHEIWPWSLASSRL